MLAVLPLLAALLRGLGSADGVVTVLYRAYGVQCHQAVARSIALHGVPLPVCARCFGIYLGLGAGALLGWPRLGERALIVWVFAALLVTLFDVASEALGFRPALAALRVAVGMLLGYAVGIGVRRLAARPPVALG